MSASAALAKNMRTYRIMRGMTRKQLAERMSALGYAWTAGIVGYVERHDRAVTVDELVALTGVLETNILELLEPEGVLGWRVRVSDRVNA